MELGKMSIFILPFYMSNKLRIKTSNGIKILLSDLGTKNHAKMAISGTDFMAQFRANK